MTVLQVDFETRGTLELKRTGVYPYALHHDTCIWLMAWAFDGEEPGVWYPDREPLPERLAAHIQAGGEMRAWNAQFERVMWRDCLTRQVPGVVVPFLEQWHCTEAEAMAMALPRRLETAAKALGLALEKDMEGNKLMLRMCRPRRFDKETGEPVWWADDAKLQRLGTYARQDVRVERAIGKLVRRLRERERGAYLRNQRMNDQGVHLDLTLVTAMRNMAAVEITRQNQLLFDATGGDVAKVTRVGQLKQWLSEQGLETESLDKKALAELLDDQQMDLSPDVRAALEARREAGKSSLAKLNAMIDCVSLEDQRMRGLVVYHGASTGREAGKLVQPHNFPRGTVPEIEAYIPHVLANRPDLMRALHVEGKWPGLLTVLSSMLRSTITAAPGAELLCADFSGIEARVLAWLAGDQRYLQLWRDGKPVYKEMAAYIFKKPVEEIVKPGEEYTIGKNTILGCGFGMGADKFARSTGATPEMAKLAVDGFREMFPLVPEYWRNLNGAAISAVEHPGQPFKVNNVKYVLVQGYLWCVLPAGRSLAYAAPKVVDRLTPWGEMRPAVEFSGVDPYTHRWERQATYGGALTENVVQAVARDLLIDAEKRIADAGYSVVLKVHDEIVAEMPGSFDTSERYEKFLALMKEVPSWAKSCPIDAEGWRGARYRK